MRISSGKTLACLSLMLGIIAGCHSATRDPTAAAVDTAKIDPELATAAGDLTHGAPATVRTDTQGRLLVYVYVTDTSAATLGKVMDAGLTDSQPSPRMGVIQGWIAPMNLGTLAGLACVERITLPRYASPR